MSAGIVVQFQRRFNIRKELQKLEFKWPCAARIDRTFNLISKNQSSGKPTYETLEKALEDMKNQIEKDEIEYLAMPRIGCGLDKLSWGRVREIIQKIFKEIEIEILICFLK